MSNNTITTTGEISGGTIKTDGSIVKIILRGHKNDTGLLTFDRYTKCFGWTSRDV